MAADSLTIRVDFFKMTGKWYTGGEVEVGEARLWQGEAFMQAIVDNQKLMQSGWQGQYHVVTDDLSKFDKDPSYREFSKAFISADKWLGFSKSSKIS